MLKLSQLRPSHHPCNCLLKRTFVVPRSSEKFKGYIPPYAPAQVTKPAGLPPRQFPQPPPPRSMKRTLDGYVTGQDNAKRILSVAVYNHYLRTRFLQAQADITAADAMEDQDPEPVNKHPVISDFPGQREGASLPPPTIDKSNVLLLGPTGSGKTLLARTLAKILDVPLHISDCTGMTEAGYIGDDVERCVERLLASCDWDVRRAESGIICLDEVDKIARHPDRHGKDVSGEGVQQALLKMLEGATVECTDKVGKDRQRTTAGLGSGTISSQKGDVYVVDTSNILFILSGAFVGMEELIAKRLDKGSIGFGNAIRRDRNLESEEKAGDDDKSGLFAPDTPKENLLDLLEPADLIKFGFIPEFVGRIPTFAPLAKLSLSQLLHILTEPHNSLVSQYKQIFALSSVELHFTTPALARIARRALVKKTGARALRRIMDQVLQDAMFEAPGGGIRYVVVDEEAAKERGRKPVYFSRGQKTAFHNLIDEEEARWQKMKAKYEAINDNDNAGQVQGRGEEFGREYEEPDRQATSSIP